MNLPDLLTEARRFDCEYAGGLSNHLPMALVALQALGADDARLASFAAGYADRLEPAPPPCDWPAGDPWAGRLGDRDAWPAYRHLFEAWLTAEDAGDVLRQVLPQLMQGVGAAAFHGPIRTAAALRCRHRGELADALAYWACRWLPLGVDAGGGRVLDPTRLLPELPRPRAGGRRTGLIFERMAAAAAQPGFGAVVARLRVDDATLERLARLAARLFAASGDFTALHLVTACHAVRGLVPFLDEPLPALSAFWRAFAAGVVASGLDPAARRHAGGAPPRAGVLVAAALASEDEHVVKLVQACQDEQEAHGGAADWQRAAARAVRDARPG